MHRICIAIETTSLVNTVILASVMLKKHGTQLKTKNNIFSDFQCGVYQTFVFFFFIIHLQEDCANWSLIIFPFSRFIPTNGKISHSLIEWINITVQISNSCKLLVYLLNDHYGDWRRASYEQKRLFAVGSLFFCIICEGSHFQWEKIWHY